MSQQELVPEPHNGPSQDYDEQYMSPRQRPAKRRDRDLLKEEHPSTFESSIPPYSYQAQDEAASTQRRAPVERAEGAHRQQQFSPDGDAFEYGYRPYRQAQQVPPWARPQRHRSRGIVFWIVLIALALLLVKALPLLIALTVGVIGLVAFTILLPVFIILIVLALLALIAMIVLIALGVPISGWFLSRSHRHQGRPGRW